MAPRCTADARLHLDRPRHTRGVRQAGPQQPAQSPLIQHTRMVRHPCRVPLRLSSTSSSRSWHWIRFQQLEIISVKRLSELEIGFTGGNWLSAPWLPCHSICRCEIRTRLIGRYD